ncbi:hypothetical protein [Wenyingzhuangia sp. IMCC45467]
MKKVKYIIVLFILFYTVGSRAQEMNYFKTLKYQPTNIPDEKSEIVLIEKTNDGGLITIHEKTNENSFRSKSTYYICYYNSSLKRANRRELKISAANKIFFNNDSLYFVSYKKELVRDSITTKKIGQNTTGINFTILSASIDKLNFTEKNWVSLNKSNTDLNLDSFNFNFQLLVQNNDIESQKNLLLISESTFELDENILTKDSLYIKATDTLKRDKKFGLALNIKLFNENLKNCLNRDVFIKNNIGKIKVLESLVDTKTNTVYLLTVSTDYLSKKLFSPKEEGKTKVHQLIKISSDSIHYTTIGNDEYNLPHIKIKLFENEIICAGMYSIQDDYTLMGFYKLNINKKDLSKTSSNYFKFNEQFLSDWDNSHTNNNLSNNRKGAINKNTTITDSGLTRRINNLFFTYFHIDEHGNCILNLNERLTTSQTTSWMSSIPSDPTSLRIPMNSKNVYKHISIITTKISNNNKIIWARNIKNKETKQSYGSIYTNNTNYIFQNDTPRTHALYNSTDKKDRVNDYLYYYKLSDNGTLTSTRFDPSRIERKTQFISDNNNNLYLYIDEERYFEVYEITE